MREKLKQARQAAGMTQQQVADEIGVTLVYYQKIESGERVGRCSMWDRLEDMFNVHQRILRENHPGQGDSQ